MPDEPCEAWATIANVRDCNDCSSESDYPDDAISPWITVASAWLYRASGRRYTGECSATGRPVPQEHARPVVSYPRPPRDVPHSLPPSRPWPAMGRKEGAHEVPLGYWPLRSITSVHVDGSLLASSAYRIDDDRYLVRIDGDVWPNRQDWTKDPTAETDSGWTVTFTYGEDPPADGVRAAAVLACELTRACSGSTCSLPKRLVSVVSEGVSMTAIDPFEFLDRGRFGIMEIDGFVATSNPNMLAEPPAVIIPGERRALRRTDTTISGS